MRLAWLAAPLFALNVASAQTPAFQSGKEIAPASEESFIGKDFWIVPNAKAFGRLTFLTEPSAFSLDKEKTIFPSSTAQFHVLSRLKGTPKTGFEDVLEVQFVDGPHAFVRESELRRRIEPMTRAEFALASDELATKPASARPHELHAFGVGSRLRGASASPNFDEVVYVEDPVSLRAAADDFEATRVRLLAAQQAAAQQAAAAQRAKGGVAIGMTAKQVLASSWGRPESINTTTTARGTREQWVYPGSQYLYLENGILAAIQSH